MNKYESVIIINPNVDEAALKALQDKFTGLINENGKAEEPTYMGLKKLAYEIGTVFGQKEQLWTHLTPYDNFKFFGAIYDFKNATGKNRYSEYDITDGNEEVDPMNERFGSQKSYSNQNSVESKFCPYCGTAVKEQYEYCNNCGKKLP